MKASQSAFTWQAALDAIVGPRRYWHAGDDLCPRPQATGEALDLAGAAPVVIKTLEAMQGIGVVLANTKRSAKSVVAAMKHASAEGEFRSNLHRGG